ncbi:MAG: hypothetical protein IKC07_02170, partial [Clostridia bacterium]|nr:hypothetical protein [Clostridia bacterium]
MKRISVVPNVKKDKGLVATAKLIDILLSFGKEVLIEEKLDYPNAQGVIKVNNDELAKADLLVVLGGDGTILEV